MGGQQIGSLPPTAAGFVPEPSGMLYLSSNQLNLVDGVATKIDLNAIGAGYTDGIENTVTHRIVPGPAGYYSICGCVYFEHVVASKKYTAMLTTAAGLLQISYSIVHSNSNNDLTARFSLPCFKMALNSWIELWAKSESGDNTVDVKAQYTFLEVQRVR